MKILQNGTVRSPAFLDVSSVIAAGGEKGLLGVAFHPGFANPASPGFRKFYTYTTVTPSGPADFTVPHSAPFDNQSLITEWQVAAADPNVVDPATRRDVLRIDHPQSNHNGGKIAFRPSDGYLYIATGDGGAGNDVGDGHTPNLGNGQDITNLLGKILRIDPLAPALTAGARTRRARTGSTAIRRRIRSKTRRGWMKFTPTGCAIRFDSASIRRRIGCSRAMSGRGRSRRWI